MARQGTVKVNGLRELNMAFSKMGKETKKGFRDDLKAIGEPVRLAAEQKAIGQITDVASRWSGMRTGVTTKVGYVAPKARRRTGSPRPNFATLMLFRALIPALEQNEQNVVAGFEKWLDKLAGEGGF